MEKSPVRSSRFASWIVWYWVMLCAPSCVWSQLRIVTYNTAEGPRDGLATVLEAIGTESVGGVARPADMIILQEQLSSATTTQAIVDLLGTIYGPGVYSRATVDGASGGPSRPGLIYNTQSLTLLEQSPIGSVESEGPIRQPIRYRLRPVGYDASADFVVYASHYKAGTEPLDLQRRDAEAELIRADSDALGADSHVIYAGDYNTQSSSESSYQRLLAAGPGQAFDPIDTPAVWHNNALVRATHTQAPAFDAPPDLIGGGMDDRFDFQLVSGEFLDGEGLDYIDGSYHAFGNNGTHFCCNSPITTGTGGAPEVLAALAGASDHLPVVADYQLPARMGMAVATLPRAVERGSALELAVTVTNTAEVDVPHGADELDYRIDAAGSLSGSATGVLEALGGGRLHLLPFDTSSAGFFEGSIHASSESQSVFAGEFSQSVSTIVYFRGDMDLDNDTDFDDIDDFVLGLNSPAFYELLFGLPSSFPGDLDLNGLHDFDDIDFFIERIGAGAKSLPVAEPSTAVLAAGASVTLICLAAMRRDLWRY